jgi:hypothetical protein
MSKINLECPINNLSFGNVAFGITHELFKRGIDCNIFPIGNIDLSSFDKASEEYKQWLDEGIKKALKDYKRTDVGLKLWHISNSQNRISNKSFLYTFHELDQITPVEKNILQNVDGVFTASDYTEKVFKEGGIENVWATGLGFDNTHFHKIEKRLVPSDTIVIGICGKFENARKYTGKILNLLGKLYGDNPKYIIHAAVTNIFLNNEQNNQLIAQALEGKKYFNFNFLPFTKTSTEFNKVINSIDIIVDCGNEGWSLPSFTACALGKFAVLHDCMGISSWAQSSGAELIESTGKIDCYDNMFFHKGAQVNQGQFFTFDEDDLRAALKRAEINYLEQRVNSKGIEMQKIFTWEKTVNKILEKIL